MAVKILSKRQKAVLRIRRRRFADRIRRHFLVNRIFDFLAALFLLVFFAPLLAVLGVLVKLNSPGPVFYRGARVGRDNTIFRVVKFRTLPIQYEESVGRRILKEKERYNSLITHFLVRFKFDEMPQLINVLKGEMSLVGPRPVRPIFYSRFIKEIPDYKKRFEVPPGITGLSQIIGGYYMDPENKLKYDLIYIGNKSLTLDVKLIVLTIATLVFSRQIMKAKIIEKFLGFELNVTDADINPSGKIVEKVTASDA